MDVLLSFLIYLAAILPPAESQERSIGVITTLSGGMATIGTAVKNGVQLAREDNPGLFQNLRFTIEDDQFDPKLSLSVYRKLKAEQPPFVLLGFGTILAQAIGPLVEQDRIPLINFNFEAAPVVGRPHIVRAMNHTDQYMRVLATYLNRRNSAVFPIVKTEATFFNAMIASLNHAFAGTKTLEEVAVVNPGETDFRTIVAKLRLRKTREIGIFLWPEQLLAFLRQAREMGLKAEYFGTDLCETAAVLASSDNLLEGCLYPDNEVTGEYREKYRSRFGDEAQLTFAGSAYDMTQLVGSLLQNERMSNSEQLLDELASVKNRTGVLGIFSYAEDATTGKFFNYPVHMKQIIGRRGVAIERRGG